MVVIKVENRKKLWRPCRHEDFLCSLWFWHFKSLTGYYNTYEVLLWRLCSMSLSEIFQTFHMLKKRRSTHRCWNFNTSIVVCLHSAYYPESFSGKQMSSLCSIEWISLHGQCFNREWHVRLLLSWASLVATSLHGKICNCSKYHELNPALGFD